MLTWALLHAGSWGSWGGPWRPQPTPGGHSCRRGPGAIASLAGTEFAEDGIELLCCVNM